MISMEFLFWISVVAVGYAYVGYPLLLWSLARARPVPFAIAESGVGLPSVSLILPAHNEASVLSRKLDNCLALDYPPERVRVLVVSDGSTDDTAEIVAGYSTDPRIEYYTLPTRQGKAAALNKGLEQARGDIVVYSDASIMLQPDALRCILVPLQDPRIGCVSGEDHIEGAGGEGLYGRYELLLRNLESRVGSIVGASGSFYAQRRFLCVPFVEGMAPDFLSVLHTVEQGYRAVTEPTARGVMTSVRRTQDEFRRKVRTLIRGMAALWANRRLLSPLRTGFFAIELWSHKVMRWLVPVFLLTALLSSALLAGQPFYLAMFGLQALFYCLAAGALVWPRLQHIGVVRIAAYFSVVNLAILVAWFMFLGGVRMEVWSPSRRAS